uniref:Uncharacterized protein n=1 Tax=Arundo donax TaxID=35708 RepID=A0A0A9BUN0_ARUDO
MSDLLYIQHHKNIEAPMANSHQSACALYPRSVKDPLQNTLAGSNNTIFLVNLRLYG